MNHSCEIFGAFKQFNNNDYVCLEETKYMVLISKNKKNRCGGVFFLFSCRILTASFTKNDTPPWMFLFHFAIEKISSYFQINQSAAQYGF